MNRLSKIYNDNKQALMMGGAFALTAASAFYLFRRRQHANLKWRDPDFKEENINLYSEEAEVRKEQIKDVSYRLILNLSDEEQDGFEGALRTTFYLMQ